MSKEYRIEDAKCGCPRYEIQEGVQPPKQMFGGHTDGCTLPAPKPPKSSTGQKGTKK